METNYPSSHFFAYVESAVDIMFHRPGEIKGQYLEWREKVDLGLTLEILNLTFPKRSWRVGEGQATSTSLNCGRYYTVVFPRTGD